MVQSRLKQRLAALLALTQLVSPVLASTSFEYRPRVPNLVVNGASTSNGATVTTPATPAAVVSLSTSTLAFGSAEVGQTSSLSVRLTNTGNGTLTLSGAPALSGSSAFTFPSASATSCASTLAPNAYCDTTVEFNPTSTGGAAGTLTFANNTGTATVALTGSATAETSAQVSFLGHFDGANGAVTAYDASGSGNHGAMQGAAALSTATAATGASSLKLNPLTTGAADYVVLPASAGVTATGPFTVEAWVYTTYRGSNLQAVYNQYENGSATRTLFNVLGDGRLEVGHGEVDSLYSTNAVPLNAWTHIAMTRDSSNTLRVFINGQTEGSVANWSHQIESSRPWVGRYNNASNNSGAFHGYIDELRVTRGLARYTGNFTPSAVPFAPAATSSTFVANTSTDFGTVTVGASSSRTFTFTNTGSFAATGTQATLTGAASVVLAANTCGTAAAPATVATGGSCAVTVKYEPTENGALAATSLRVDTNSVNAPHSLNLTGLALAPVASISSSSLAFGAVDVGSSSSLTVRLTNTGAGTLVLASAPALTGDATFAFPSTGGTNCGASLAPNAYCDTTVTFSPNARVSSTGSLNFASNVAGSPTVVSLTGSGALALASVAASSGSSTDFGAVMLNSTASRNFTFTNTGDRTLSGVQTTVTGSGLSLASNNCGTAASPVTVAVGATCTFSVAYAPTAVASLTGASVSVASSASNGPSTLSLTGSGIAETAVTSFLGHFDGISGSTTIADSSGLSNTGTAYGAAALSTAQSKFGGSSLLLNAAAATTTDYVMLPAAAAVAASGQFTVEGWIYTTYNGGAAQNIYNQYESGTAGRFNFYLTPNTQKLEFGHGTGATVTSSSSVPVNTWVHVAVTRDASNTLRLFINGNVEATSSNYTASMEQSRPWVGKNNNATYSGSPFHGYLDEMRVTQGTARYIGNFTPAGNSYVAPADAYASSVSFLYHADTALTPDVAGNSVAGVGSPTLSTANYKFGGGAASFTGTNYAYVDDASGSKAAFGTGDFTVEAWVRPTSTSCTYGCAIAGNWADGAAAPAYTNYSGWTLRINRSSGNYGVQFAYGYNLAVGVGASGLIPANAWTHIAVTRQANAVKVWVNGVQQGSTATVSNSIGSGVGALVLGNTDGTNVAKSSGSVYTGFVGQIDEVRVTKGVARYSSTFTPATAAFPNP